MSNRRAPAHLRPGAVWPKLVRCGPAEAVTSPWPGRVHPRKGRSSRTSSTAFTSTRTFIGTFRPSALVVLGIPLLENSAELAENRRHLLCRLGCRDRREVSLHHLGQMG